MSFNLHVILFTKYYYIFAKKDMEKQYMVVDLKSSKGITVAQSNEHLRIAKDGAYRRNISVNFDPSREHLNFEVTIGGRIIPVNKNESIPLRIRRNLKKRGIKDPNAIFKTIPEREKNGRRTIANFLIEGSRETMRQLAFGDQQVDWKRGADNRQITRCEDIEKWAVDMYKFMAMKFGEENIAAFEVHLDETTPHIHCMVLPITKINKFSWKTIFHGESKEAYVENMRRFNDEIAVPMAKYGLQRGEDTRKRGARHRTTEQYRDYLDELCSLNEKRISEQKQEISDLDSDIESKKQELYQLNAQIKLATRKINSLTTMIANLEEKMRHVEEDTKEYNELYVKLCQRREQITEANDEMERLAGVKRELRDNISDMERQQHIIQQELAKENTSLEEKTVRDLEQTGWRMAAEDAMRTAHKWEQLRETLTPSQIKLFDDAYEGSFLEAMAHRANDVIAVGLALSLGYVDAAVSFAASHGGGGVHPGGGWGRKMDDDDDMWNRKCLFMAMHMMRPIKRSSSKI